MLLKIQLCIIGLNDILWYIQIENNYLNSNIFTDFDQINAALVKVRD